MSFRQRGDIVTVSLAPVFGAIDNVLLEHLPLNFGLRNKLAIELKGAVKVAYSNAAATTRRPGSCCSFSATLVCGAALVGIAEYFTFVWSSPRALMLWVNVGALVGVFISAAVFLLCVYFGHVRIGRRIVILKVSSRAIPRSPLNAVACVAATRCDHRRGPFKSQASRNG